MTCRLVVVAAVCVLVLGLATSLRQYLNPDELPSVKSMCDAQCEMLCLEIGIHGGDCLNQGYCAALEKYSHGYVPQKPIINVERNVLAQTLTVRWTKISSMYKIIYVLQWDQTASPTLLLNGPPMEMKTKQKTTWITLGWADSSYFIFHNFTDVCLRPKFRVAAVSRFGSRWFTEAVQTPELQPGRATSILASNFHYVQNNPGEVYFQLTWDDPPGWKRSDVLLYHWRKGPSTCQQVEVFFQNPRGLQIQQLSLRIPEHGIGCTFNLQMEVVSRCNPSIGGPMANFKFLLDCSKIANYTCKPPIYNPPGNVENINLRVIPTNKGPLIQISWQPPSDLGSLGVIDKYHIKWGKLNQSTFDALLQIGSLYDTHNFTIPGTQLWTVIQLGKVSRTYIYGVQIMPSAPGHDILYWRAPVHNMPTLPADWPQLTNDSTSHIPTPHIIKDDKGVIIVLVPIHPHPSVRLFLNMPEKQFDNEVEGFAVQWGHTEHKKGSTKISIDVLNSTYIPKK
ncbi:uncharacterized protein LOC121369784 [Gigantopelta aegis]|uniref:uncharacterized protein LOC121369784 n=1 Tax=Gigantopelta aegis TaxID=1735272 RepID=UPI001B88ABDD|nr:uncharacterized protein LOC121369784 [Gigantopelta aegis]